MNPIDISNVSLNAEQMPEIIRAPRYERLHLGGSPVIIRASYPFLALSARSWDFQTEKIKDGDWYWLQGNRATDRDLRQGRCIYKRMERKGDYMSGICEAPIRLVGGYPNYELIWIADQ